MFKVTFTEEHMKNLYYCLDKVLKEEGLAALSAVTELHNVLASAEVVAPPSPPMVEMKGEPKNEEEA